MTDEKIKMKLKMMEISFEQVNNSRNNLITQLANAETIIEKVSSLWLAKPNKWVESMYEVLSK